MYTRFRLNRLSCYPCELWQYCFDLQLYFKTNIDSRKAKFQCPYLVILRSYREREVRTMQLTLKNFEINDESKKRKEYIL
jgi:hypothetical protein